MNLPNKISMARILIMPVMIAVLLIDAIPWNGLIGGSIFILAASTDALDGYIARKYGLVTDLGKFLDSIADKVLVMSALTVAVFLCPVDYLAPVLAALVCVCLAREFLISALRQIAAGKSVILAADKLGKLKTIFQCIAVPVLLIAADFSALLDIDVQYLYSTGFSIFALSTFFALLSAVNYLWKNRKVYLADDAAKDTAEDTAQ